MLTAVKVGGARGIRLARRSRQTFSTGSAIRTRLRSQAPLPVMVLMLLLCKAMTAALQLVKAIAVAVATAAAAVVRQSPMHHVVLQTVCCQRQLRTARLLTSGVTR